MLWKDEGRLHLGAEAEVRAGLWLGIAAVKKIRNERSWRHPDLDRALIRRRLEAECRCLRRLRSAGIMVPILLEVDRVAATIIMSRMPGQPLVEVLRRGIDESDHLFHELGQVVRGLHRAGVAHGDLSTNNILWQQGESPSLIDLGLSTSTTEVEAFGIDLHLLDEILRASHPEYENAIQQVEAGYLSVDEQLGPPEQSSAGALPSAGEVHRRLQQIRKRVRYHD